MALPHSTKKTNWQNGNDPATGTAALGTTFGDEYDQLYENDNHLESVKLDKSGGTVSGNLIVQGDLTIEGAVTEIETTNLEIEDKVITLNKGEAGPGVSGDGISGIEVDRGSGQAKAKMTWDEALALFKTGLAGSEETIFGMSKLPELKEPTTNQVYSAFAYHQAIVAAPTADMTMDISAGANKKGTTCFIKNNANNYWKITVTIAVGITEKIYLGAFKEFIWDGIEWKIVRESRIGKFQMFLGTIIPRGAFKLNGTEYNRADYPEFWHWADNETTTIDDASWLAGAVGAFSRGSVETKFRTADWEGLHIRFSGANSVMKMAAGGASDWFDGGSVLAIQNDMGHDHRHNLPNTWDQALGGSNGRLLVGGSTVYPIGPPVANGSNGTPRLGKETKPVTVSVIPIIYFED